VGRLSAAAVGLIVIAVLFPHTDFRYGQVTQQVALETATCLITVLAGFLVYGRFQRHSRHSELVLVAALAVITLSNVLFVMLPMLTGNLDKGGALVAALTGRTGGSVLFALAAFVPRTRLPHRQRAQGLAALSVAGILTLSVVLAHIFGADDHVLTHAGAVRAVQGLQAAVAIAAGFGYLRRSARPGDECCAWLSVAAIFAAAAHLNYAVDPPTYADRLSLGDMLRLCFYVVLLIASAREIGSYWRTLASALIAAERRRIARDLHDGLSQELAFLTRNLTSLQLGADHAAVDDLLGSVERAREVSRDAIKQVAAPVPASAADALTQAVGPVARRFGLDLHCDLATGIALAPLHTSALIGIACEALVNVAKHSGSQQVSLALSREGSRVHMRVRDAGRGFDTTAFRQGFGLTSMRERARAVGGEVHVRSEPGRGSIVEATL
jgi:signal transduction histidine kinase